MLSRKVSKTLTSLHTAKRKVENNEWHNAHQHIRRVEWKTVFDVGTEEQTTSPKKLKITKHPRPDTERLDEGTVAYVEAVVTKLRNLKEGVHNLFHKRKNLPKDQRKSLEKINKALVHSRVIVVCRADKDGKIIVINYEDYRNILLKELEQFRIFFRSGRYPFPP